MLQLLAMMLQLPPMVFSPPGGPPAFSSMCVLYVHPSALHLSDSGLRRCAMLDLRTLTFRVRNHGLLGRVVTASFHRMHCCSWSQAYAHRAPISPVSLWRCWGVASTVPLSVEILRTSTASCLPGVGSAGANRCGWAASEGSPPPGWCLPPSRLL